MSWQACTFLSFSGARISRVQMAVQLMLRVQRLHEPSIELPWVRTPARLLHDLPADRAAMRSSQCVPPATRCNQQQCGIARFQLVEQCTECAVAITCCKATRAIRPGEVTASVML